MKFSILAVLILLLGACAQPDYLESTPLAPQNSQQTETCAYSFAKAALCADLKWTQGPQSPGESEFILKFWSLQTGSANGPFVDPQENLSVVLWMPSMGHGSSPVKIEKLDNGVYRVRKVYFIMPGDWEVRLFLKNAAGQSEQQTVKLEL